MWHQSAVRFCSVFIPSHSRLIILFTDGEMTNSIFCMLTCHVAIGYLVTSITPPAPAHSQTNHVFTAWSTLRDKNTDLRRYDRSGDRYFYLVQYR
jgi:hypothetical protein